MRFILLIYFIFFSTSFAEAYTFTAKGKFVYEDKEWDWQGWTGQVSLKPIRKASVKIRRLSNSNIIGSGYTRDDGTFEIEIKNTNLFLGDLRAELESNTDLYKEKADSNFPHIRVKNYSGDVYILLSEEIKNHYSDQDADFGTTVSTIMVIADEEGNPFNIMDMAVHVWDYIGGVIKAPPQGPYKLIFPSYTGSYYAPKSLDAYIDLTDGYDDAVILHEIGHMVHGSYSENDSPGGIHYWGDSDQDPRLSFSEGYATFFAGTILLQMQKPGIYVDADADKAQGGYQLRADLENANPWSKSVSGEADELAVTFSLFDLLDTEQSPDTCPGYDDDPFTSETMINADTTPALAWWEVFTGPIKEAGQLTIHDAWKGWFKKVAPMGDPHYESIKKIFQRRKIRFFETDLEASEEILIIDPPVASTLFWGPIETLYKKTGNDPYSPGGGDVDKYKVYLETGQTLVVETGYPQGPSDAGTYVDPKMELINTGGYTVAADDNSGIGRNSRIEHTALNSGYFTVKVYSASPGMRPTGSYRLGYRIKGDGNPENIEYPEDQDISEGCLLLSPPVNVK
jgi:hypothetical protein